MGIILIPIFTRVFAPSEYAIVDVIATVSAILIIIIIMGFETAQTFFFYDTDDSNERKTVITTVLLHRICASLIICSPMIILSPIISEFLFKNSICAIYIQLALVNVIFSVLIREIQDVQRITQNPHGYFFIVTGYAFLNTILTILFIFFFNLGLLGLYFATFISSLVFCIVGLINIRIHLSLKPSFKKMKAMLHYSLPLVPSGLSIWTMNFVDRLVLLQFCDLSAIGIYSLAVKAGLGISIIGSAFRLSWTPIAFSYKDNPEGPDFFSLVFKWYFLLIMVICTFTSLFAYEALTIISTPTYYAAYLYIAPIVFSQAAWNLIPILALGSVFKKKTIVNFFAFGIASILNLGLNLIFVPLFGVIASAFSTLVSYVFALGYFNYYSQKYYPFQIKLENVLKLCIITCIIIVMGIFLDQTPNLITSGLKLLLLIFYISMIMLFSIVEIKDLKMLRKMFSFFINHIKNKLT